MDEIQGLMVVQDTTNLTLAVRGNDKVKIGYNCKRWIVDKVDIIENAFEFSEPLSIITTNNSNGYDIDAITHSGTSVTSELLDPQFNKPATTGYVTTDTKLPFAVGDKVFVENCRIKPSFTCKWRR